METTKKISPNINIYYNIKYAFQTKHYPPQQDSEVDIADLVSHFTQRAAEAQRWSLTFLLGARS